MLVFFVQVLLLQVWLVSFLVVYQLVYQVHFLVVYLVAYQVVYLVVFLYLYFHYQCYLALLVFQLLWVARYLPVCRVVCRAACRAPPRWRDHWEPWRVQQDCLRRGCLPACRCLRCLGCCQACHPCPQHLKCLPHRRWRRHHQHHARSPHRHNGREFWVTFKLSGECYSFFTLTFWSKRLQLMLGHFTSETRLAGGIQGIAGLWNFSFTYSRRSSGRSEECFKVLVSQHHFHTSTTTGSLFG